MIQVKHASDHFHYLNNCGITLEPLVVLLFLFPWIACAVSQSCNNINFTVILFPRQPAVPFTVQSDQITSHQLIPIVVVFPLCKHFSVVVPSSSLLVSSKMHLRDRSLLNDGGPQLISEAQAGGSMNS